MKPVDQPFKNDCVRACIASILEIPIDEVPRFVEQNGSGWRVAVWNWLDARGYGFIEMPFKEVGRKNMFWTCGHFIAMGISPRHPDGKIQHAVVFKGYDLAHDPHPEKNGLVGEPLSAMFLIRS